MKASLRSLLGGVIDYAGLFPPAKLEMAEAVAKYVEYGRGSESWIVSRFVCPSSRLPEFLAALEGHPEAGEVPVSVTGQANEDLSGWHAALEHDAKVMTAFLREAGDRAAIEAYEVRIPSHRDIGECVRDLKAFAEIDVFVELPWGVGLEDSLATVAESEWLFAKARTGGVTPAAFPTAPQLAQFIHGAVALDLSFKLTAGLHHPLPRIDSSTGARMHGFLNVLAATSLALGYDLTRSEVEDVLESAHIDDWVFEDDEMRWRDQDLDLEDIEDGRDVMLSIGSCSVEEPLQDLAQLGLKGGN